MEPVYAFSIAGLLVLLIPIAPKIVSFRIRALRFLHFHWLANWHERHFEGFVTAVRVILAVIAVALCAHGMQLI